MAEKKEPPPESAELAAARELVRQAREQCLSLTGPGGLLEQLTKTVLETALDEEITEHPGHQRRERASGGNIRTRQRRLSGVDEIVLSLYGKGLTAGRSRRTSPDPVPDHRSGARGMTDRSVGRLDKMYAALFIDAIVVKVRDGQVADRPTYAAKRHYRRGETR